MVREFSQTVAEKDTQSCLHVENCHSLVPGMSQYGESQEFSQVGIAVENDAELTRSLNRAQESTKNNTDFRLQLSRLEFSCFFSSFSRIPLKSDAREKKENG